jgi:hypothetical protein
VLTKSCIVEEGNKKTPEETKEEMLGGDLRKS